MLKSRNRGTSSVPVAIAACVTVALTGVAGQAVSQQQSVGDGLIQFVEVPGSMEFSGRLIARPWQAEDLAEKGIGAQQADAMIRMAKVTIAQYDEFWYEPLVDHHVINVPEGMHENEVVNQLMQTGLFEFVEPDWTLYPIGCPNDSRFNNQWHHDANKMRSCDAWDIETGNSSITVAICDTGIQTSHPEFAQHRKEGYNAVNRLWENQGGDIGPIHPHGTMTTGCAAANGNNGTGIAGVGWNFSHRMMRVSNSSGGSSNLSTLTHAALTAIQAGDNVSNVSYSGVNSSSVRSTATTIKNLGGLLTWSAGNDGRNLNWGNRDNDDVIVVGATTSSDAKSGFSAFGPSVDLMAPGSRVYTTNTGSGYASVDGTSFSAPLTAGLIALIWSAEPSLTPDEVEDILKAGCDDLGSSGVDNTFGYGRINSFNSLSLVGEPNTPPTLTINSPTDGGDYDLGSSVSFNSTASDAEDGDISGQVEWESSVDGPLGTGNFSTSSLSEGLHFISAMVTDSNGADAFELISISIVDGGGGDIPTIPTPISTREVSPPGRVAFKWVDESNNETGFEIQRQQRVNGTWTNTTTVGTRNPGAQIYQEDVTQGGWRYRVQALGASGDSGYGGWTPSKPKRPNQDTVSSSNGTVTVTWADQSNLENSFEIQRRERVNGTWGAWSTIATVPADTETFDDQPGTGRFRYRIRSLSDALDSKWQFTNAINN